MKGFKEFEKDYLSKNLQMIDEINGISSLDKKLIKLMIEKALLVGYGTGYDKALQVSQELIKEI